MTLILAVQFLGLEMGRQQPGFVRTGYLTIGTLLFLLLLLHIATRLTPEQQAEQARIMAECSQEEAFLERQEQLLKEEEYRLAEQANEPEEEILPRGRPLGYKLIKPAREAQFKPVYDPNEFGRRES